MNHEIYHPEQRTPDGVRSPTNSGSTLEIMKLISDTLEKVSDIQGSEGAVKVAAVFTATGSIIQVGYANFFGLRNPFLIGAGFTFHSRTT